MLATLLIGSCASPPSQITRSDGGTDAPPRLDGPAAACRLVANVDLPSAFDGRIERVGRAFAANGSFERGAGTGWATIAADGAIGPITRSAESVYPYALAFVGKAGPADQLVAVSRGPADLPVSSPRTPLLASVLPRGATQWVAGPLLLATNDNGQTRQTAIGTSLDGRRAIFAIGQITLESPRSVVLGPDGQPMGAPVVVPTRDLAWQCLAVIPTGSGGAVSLIDQRDGDAIWRLSERDAAGALVLDAAVPLGAELTGGPALPCPVAASTARGFVLAAPGPRGQNILVEIDRATWSSAGATIVHTTSFAQPGRILGIADVSGGLALLGYGGGGSPDGVALVDTAGQPRGPLLPLPAELAGLSPIGAEPGLLIFTYQSPRDQRRVLATVECP